MVRSMRIGIGVFACLLSAGVASAAYFIDIETSAYGNAIVDLADRGVVQGYGDGTFRPNAPINRAEFLKILMESRFPGRSPVDLMCFRDLEVKIPQWYARTTCAAEELGIVQGYHDGTFQPERNVLLVEALKMALRTYGFSPAPSVTGEWYEPYLQEARNRDMLIPLLKSPAHVVTRGEMAVIADMLITEREQALEDESRTVPVCGNGVTEYPEQCDDGNVKDSDGCSSICLIVPEPIRRAILQIDQETSGTLTAIAQGQKKLALLKFTATSGRQDSKLTALIFKPSVGSLLYASHYTLAMDRNGDGIYETVAQENGRIDGSSLVFDTLVGGGVNIPNGLSVPFVVRADLATGLGPVTLGLAFDTSDPGYVEAQGETDGLALEGIETDGSCTANNCFILVNTRGSTDINIKERGNLFVTEDNQSTRSAILLGGSSTNQLLRLRLRAEGENVDVYTIRIDGVVTSVETLLLYRLRPGETFNPNATPFAQASHGQCPEQPATRFCALISGSPLVVSPSEDTVVVVAARMKNKQLGAVSGQLSTLSLNASSESATAAIKARGTSSSQDLNQNDGNGMASGEIFIGMPSPGPNVQISGKNSDTALASIGSVTNDGPSQESYVPSGFVSFASFTVSALPHSNSFQGTNDVVLQSMTFHVTAQNVQIDPASVVLSTKDTPSVTATCTAGGNTGTFDIVCSGLPSSPIQARITQGQFQTYRLSANVTNTAIGQGTSILTASLATLGQRNQTNSIIWSDEVTTFQWVDVPQTSVQGTVWRSN